MKIIQNVQVVSPIDRGDHYRKKENNLWGEDHEHWMIFESRCILWLKWSSIDKLSLDTSTTSCSVQCGRWKAAFTRRCPPTLALWQGGVIIVIVIVIVIVNDIIYKKMSNSNSRTVIFARERYYLSGRSCWPAPPWWTRTTISSSRRRGSPGWKITHLTSIASFTSSTCLSSHHWQLQVTPLWQGVQLPLLSEELHLSWWSRPVSWEYWGSSLNIENIENIENIKGRL